MCGWAAWFMSGALRHERLSWDHHCVLARLPEEEIGGWIEACVAELDAGRPLTLRRLRRSLNLGRLASREELDRDGDDRGIANHIPLLIRPSSASTRSADGGPTSPTSRAAR